MKHFTIGIRQHRDASKISIASAIAMKASLVLLLLVATTVVAIYPLWLMFNEIDTNRDKQLTVKEISVYYKEKISDDLFLKFESSDKNRDGVLNYKEFLVFVDK